LHPAILVSAWTGVDSKNITVKKQKNNFMTLILYLLSFKKELVTVKRPAQEFITGNWSKGGN
jgi:hypothetical protein